MYKGFKKAAVLGLSACLALTSLAGCSKDREFDAEATAVTVNDDTISAGVVKFATHYEQALSEEYYSYMMGGVTNIFNQDLYGTGTTFGDMLKEQIVSRLTRGVLAEQKMDEYGVTVTEEDRAAITAAAAEFIEENEEEVLEEMGASQETIERYLELELIISRMETAMSADVDTEVSDEEAAQREIQYTLFTTAAETESDESESGTEAVDTEAVAGTEAAEEAETAAETEAEEAETAPETEAETAVETEAEAETAALETNAMETTGSAEETEAVTEAETEAETAEETEIVTEAETEAETAEEETETETEDPETAAAKAKALAKAEELLALLEAGEDFETASQSVDEDATCSTLTFGAEDEYYQELIDATEGLEDGTLVDTPVEVSSGYYVVRLVTQLNREATDARKEEIIEERKSEQVEALYTEWEEAAEISQEEKVLAEITFDFSLALDYETETEAAETETEAAGTESAEETTEAAAEEVTEAIETEAAETEVSETEISETEETAAETETEPVSE